MGLLLCKPEVLSSDPQYACKNLGVILRSRNPSPERRGEAEQSQGLAGQPAQPKMKKNASSEFREGPCLKGLRQIDSTRSPHSH